MYSSFIFKAYSFDKNTKQAIFHYSYDDVQEFTESYTFDFDFVDYSPEALDAALQLLFFLAGVSYYKVFLAPSIEVRSGTIDAKLASFLSITFQEGLGEFFYVNKLDPYTKIEFPITSKVALSARSNGSGALVGIGGGKDSLVSVELLRQAKIPFRTWSAGHKPQLTPLVERIGTEHSWVERTWDPLLIEVNKQALAYNGHVPISAILAATGVVAAILGGQRDVVVSNEASANEPTLVYQAKEINHQYSKSLLFERGFQTILERTFGDSVRYYSLLRPLSELRIAELFSQSGFERYKDVFSSCNKAYRHDSTAMYWDGECPKCAFVFLALTPFVDRSALETLFGGKNLLLDPNLKQTYLQLLGISADKPLECVGEIKECRAAMRKAQKLYADLPSYNFDLPEDYDFRALQDHAIPADIAMDILNKY